MLFVRLASSEGTSLRPAAWVGWCGAVAVHHMVCLFMFWVRNQSNTMTTYSEQKATPSPPSPHRHCVFCLTCAAWSCISRVSRRFPLLFSGQMLFFRSHPPCQHQPCLGVTASDESGEQGVRRSLTEGQLGMRFIWGWEGEGKAGNYRVLRMSYHFFPMATACMEVHKYVCAYRNSRLISQVERGFGHLSP